ncbi:rhomboid family intramembrane serine protease [Bacteroidota bacterium]
MITIIIISITTLISITAFRNSSLFYKFMFNPYQVIHRKQYNRLISHGFVHVNWEHLLFNMISFYFFGRYVESYMSSGMLFVIFYISAIAIASLISLVKHRNNPNYNSVGASGGVSAVIFASIIFNPGVRIMIFPIPIPIPGFIYAILFFVYSHIMGKRGKDNVNHDAHALGAVYGIVFALIVNPDFITNLVGRI